MADKDFKVKTGLDLPAPLPASEGGTGQTSLANAINALLPDQTNNASKILGTNGSSLAWTNPGAAYQTSAPSNPVTGQLWVDSDETGDSLDPYIIRRKTITATAGQTVFTTDVVFTDGYEQIYYNGVLLVRTTDYTTSGGTNTVTLLQGASAGDTVEIISSTPINLVNTLAGNSANTITAQTASSIPLTIEGASSQSASLFNIKNNAGETRYEFLPTGQATLRATGPDQASLRIERYTDDLAVLSLRSYGGTISSPTVKTNGTRIGMIAAEGYDGTSLPSAARISFFVDGTVSTGNVPGMIQFSTAPVGGGHTERMRITSAGNVYIGTTDASAYGAKLAIANTGQASLFMWNSGQGSGHIGFPASGSTMRIVNTYTDGLIANGKGIDINANGNVGVGWNPDNNWHLSVNNAGSGVGAFLSTTSGASVFSGLFEASNSSYVGVITRAQTFRSNTSAFRFFDAFSSSTGVADLEFNLRGDGQAYADGSWNAGGADYAEYFEWADGNPDNEDRRGYSVSLVGKKIKIAEDGENPIGVISGNPSIIGDAGWNIWNKKYLVDDFGSYIRDENGERILNTEFDPDAEYVSREDRPEWAVVGLMGKLRLRKGQETAAGWIKMGDISETVEEWLVK